MSERGPYMTRNRAEKLDQRIDGLEASVNERMGALEDQVRGLSGLYVDIAKRQVQALFDATRSFAEWLSPNGSDL